MADKINLKNVHISNITNNEGAISTLSAGDYIDLSRSYWVNLSLYQEYQWKIVANQTIERTFRIDNQVGVATYDLRNYIGYANMVVTDIYTPQNSTPQLTQLKLGPTGSTINNILTTNPAVTWTWVSSYLTTTVIVHFRHFA